MINALCFLAIMNIILLFRLATRSNRLAQWQLRIVTYWLVRIARRNVVLRLQAKGGN